MDLDEYNAVVKAVEGRWSHTEELLVALCQLVDNLCRITVAAHGGKKGTMGPAFRYPRPGEKTGPVVMRPRELGRRMMAGGARG